MVVEHSTSPSCRQETPTPTSACCSTSSSDQTAGAQSHDDDDAFSPTPHRLTCVHNNLFYNGQRGISANNQGCENSKLHHQNFLMQIYSISLLGSRDQLNALCCALWNSLPSSSSLIHRYYRQKKKKVAPINRKSTSAVCICRHSPGPGRVKTTHFSPTGTGSLVWWTPSLHWTGP